MKVFTVMLIISCISFAMSKIHEKVSKYVKNKYYGNSGPVSGEEMAQQILENADVKNVKIWSGKKVENSYDFKEKALYLDDGIYTGHDVTDYAIVAHECGHAVQHGKGRHMIKINTYSSILGRLISLLALALLLLSKAVGAQPVKYCLILYCIAYICKSFISLFVEYDASAKGIGLLGRFDFIGSGDIEISRRILGCGFMTYINDFLFAIVQLIAYLVILEKGLI